MPTKNAIRNLNKNILYKYKYTFTYANLSPNQINTKVYIYNVFLFNREDDEKLR